ncbi:MAG: exo-alpha-sialidase [Actinomycetota bacterium]|nr:exo-alpha-sialidase [Actinomycetota bacterium]
MWSDDHGKSWSKPVNVSPPHANSQDSQPMVLPNGTVVDAYIDFGPNASAEGPEVSGVRAAAGHHQNVLPRRAAGSSAAYPIFAIRISTDGGASWKPGGPVTKDIGGGPSNFRCCLLSATTDPMTGRMYATWNAIDPTKVKLSSSTDGIKWSAPVVVNVPDPALLGVNTDVSAYNGTVSVSYGLTNTDTKKGKFGRQFVATSRDGGAHFPPSIPVGPQINYAYAAHARGIFPGDYIGSAMSATRLYAVWAVSSTPPTSGAKYHQVLYAATFDTTRTSVRATTAPGTPLTDAMRP